MKKLFFSVFALSALILSACSGSQVVDTSSTPSSSSQTPTTSVTPSESSEPEESSVPEESSEPEESSIPEESSSAEEESSSQEESSSSEPIPSYADFRMEIGNAVYDLELFEDTETIKQYYFGEDVTKTVAAGESIAFKKRANDAYSAFDVAPSPDDYSSWIYNNVEGNEDEGYTIKAAGDVKVYLKLDKAKDEWSFWISGGGSIPKPDAGYYLCGNNIGENWNLDAEYMLAKETDPEQPNTYFINYTAIQGDEFKICEVKEDGSKVWWPHVNESEELKGYYKSSETAQSAIYKGYLAGKDASNLGTIVPGEYRIDIDTSDHGIWTSINEDADHNPKRIDLKVGLVGQEEYEASIPFGTLAAGGYKYSVNVPLSNLTLDDDIYVRWADDSALVIEFDDEENPSIGKYFKVNDDLTLSLKELSTKNVDIIFALKEGKMVVSVDEAPVLNDVTFRVKMDASDLDVYVAGDFNEWNKTAIKLNETDATNHIYSVTVPIYTGTYEYKFVKGETYEYDGVADSNRPLVVTDEMTTPVYIFNSQDVFSISTFYLCGNNIGEDWGLDTNYQLTKETDPEHPNTYYINYKAAQGDQFKICEVLEDGTKIWWPHVNESEQTQGYYKNSETAQSAVYKGYLHVDDNLNLETVVPGEYRIDIDLSDHGIWTSINMDAENEKKTPLVVTVLIPGHEPQSTPLSFTYVPQDQGGGYKYYLHGMPMAVTKGYVFSFNWEGETESAIIEADESIAEFLTFDETNKTITVKDGDKTINLDLKLQPGKIVIFASEAPVQKSVTFRVKMDASDLDVYVAGDFNNWSATEDELQEVDVVNHIYQMPIEVETGEHEFKFVKGPDWEFDGVPNSNRKFTVNADTVETPLYVFNSTTNASYIHLGRAGNWEEIILAPNGEKTEYSKTEVTLEADDILKICINDDWRGFSQIKPSSPAKANFEEAETDDNIKVLTAGSYDIYVKVTPDASGTDEGTSIYIAEHETPVVHIYTATVSVDPYEETKPVDLTAVSPFDTTLNDAVYTVDLTSGQRLTFLRDGVAMNVAVYDPVQKKDVAGDAYYDAAKTGTFTISVSKNGLLYIDAPADPIIYKVLGIGDETNPWEYSTNTKIFVVDEDDLPTGVEHQWSIELTLAQGKQFKINDGSLTNWFGYDSMEPGGAKSNFARNNDTGNDGNNVIVNVTGTYKICLKQYSSDHGFKFYIAATGTTPVTPVASAYKVLGVGEAENPWSYSTNTNVFMVDEDNMPNGVEHQWSIELNLAANNEFKINDNGELWLGYYSLEYGGARFNFSKATSGDNIVASLAGSYKFYLRQYSYDHSFHLGIEATGTTIVTPDPTYKALGVDNNWTYGTNTAAFEADESELPTGALHQWSAVVTLAVGNNFKVSDGGTLWLGYDSAEDGGAKANFHKNTNPGDENNVVVDVAGTYKIYLKQYRTYMNFYIAAVE